VRVLGELGADSVLLAYFERYRRPEDAAVLFAEDAVRSAAARALVCCKSETVFGAVLCFSRQRDVQEQTSISPISAAHS
jgi:hypothetical protein